MGAYFFEKKDVVRNSVRKIGLVILMSKRTSGGTSCSHKLSCHASERGVNHFKNLVHFS